MNLPPELKYTEEHEWIRLEEDGTATVGITDFAQENLSDIVYVEVESVGDALSKDETFGSIEAVKTVSDLFMPISGEVIAFNETLDETPELVNSAPYGQGWIIKIRPSNPSEFEELLDAGAYEALTAE